VDHVKALLEVDDIDINALGGVCGTALAAAVSEGRDAVVSLLVGRGANARIASAHLWTPLHHAAYRNRQQILRILLQRG
ncbi:hypothetical protein K488DRAFT_30442, partial [Vararia minispora EC-137]